METILCSKGNHFVPVSEFTKAKTKRGYYHWCRPCVNAHDRERYKNGDKVRRDATKNNAIKRNQELLWELLLQSQCLNCGNNDPDVLEFDHREPNKKHGNIANMIRCNAWSVILIEIAKCDILCANCHRKRTNKQFGYWRALMNA